MKKFDVKKNNDFFTMLATTKRSQATIMVLALQKSTGGPDNKHINSDQWLYVIEGNATVIIESEKIEVGQGELLLIEAGQTHEVINAGKSPLKILNIYAPPEY